MKKTAFILISLLLTANIYAHKIHYSGLGILEKAPKGNRIVLKSDVYQDYYFLNKHKNFEIGDTVFVQGWYNVKTLKVKFPTLHVQKIKPYECCRAELKGDVNADGQHDITDIVAMIDFMFFDYAPPICYSNADVLDFGYVNIVDLVAIVDYLFNNGDPLPPCEE